ncbi:MFS transporter [Desulforamulus ruminis]|uniref:MFS transporter n=1 Tax=Desulforamulus ruminis TaxID=1564 RepID=UPI0023564D15|nr:MFS transporter [Desulforamulus ruminis]
MRMNQEKYTIVIVALITSVCLLGNSMLYVTLPIYWQEVGLSSLWEVGVLLSVNRLVRLPLNPLVGWLYRKINIRTGLLIAVSLAGITTMGYGVFLGFGKWLILRCLWGLAWSLLRVGGFLTVIHLAQDHNRGHYIGIYNGLYQSGNIIGMLIGGFGAGIIGFHNIAFIFGSITLIAVIGVFVFNVKIPAPALEAASILKINWSLNPVLKVILSGLLVYMVFEGMITSTLSYVIGHHYGLLLNLLGTSVAATALAGIILGARWAWEPLVATRVGRWSDGAAGRVPLFIIFLIPASVSIAVIPIKMPIFLWLGLCFLIMITATSLTTLVDSLASDVAKKESSISISTAYIVGADLGAALGPLISYLILRYGQGVFYTYVGAALALLLTAIWWCPSLKGQSTKAKSSVDDSL